MDKNWIVWLTEDGGEIFMGLAPSQNRGERRFRVLGTFDSDGPNGVGIWINVDSVQEIEVPDNTIVTTWEVQPRSCLILWSYVAYVQRGKQQEKIGFTRSK
jgi:hypothetical protein